MNYQKANSLAVMTQVKIQNIFVSQKTPRRALSLRHPPSKLHLPELVNTPRENKASESKQILQCSVNVVRDFEAYGLVSCGFLKNSFIDYNSHTIQCSPWKHTIQMCLLWSQVVRSTRLSDSRTCSSPGKETPYPLTVISHYLISHPQPQAATNLLSLSSDLLIQHISRHWVWAHTIRGDLWLASFTLYNTVKVHPCCGMHRYFTRFYCQIILYGYITFNLSIHWAFGLFPLFPFLAIMTNPAMTVHVRVCGYTFSLTCSIYLDGLYGIWYMVINRWLHGI